MELKYQFATGITPRWFSSDSSITPQLPHIFKREVYMMKITICLHFLLDECLTREIVVAKCNI